MSLYDVYGNELTFGDGVSGDEVPQVYDVNGNPLLNRKPIKHYDYADDPDPDKPYVWDYDLQELQLIQGKKFTVGIETDTHYLEATTNIGYHNIDYVSQLKNMTKRLYFDFITNLGDIPRGWAFAEDITANTKARLDEMMRRYTDYVECPVLIATGNHDNSNNYALQHGSSMTYVISKEDLYASEIGSTKRTTTIVEPGNYARYYYKDFPECRVIVLDSNDYPYQEVSDYDVHGNHHTFSEAQVAWFANTALNTDKPVLVLSHNVLKTEVATSAGITMTVPEEDKQYDSSIPYRADEIVDALEAFQNNGGLVVASFSGHIHRQGAAKIDGINYVSFGNGGNFVEIAFIDFDNRTITTKIVGDSTSDRNDRELVERSFTF